MNLKEILKYLEEKDYALASANDTIKEDRRRIDSLVTERNELNRWFINDRDTLRSIERICVELGMYYPGMKIRDVKGIKSMNMISNIMEGWDPDIGREKEFDAHLNKAIELISIELLVGEISDQNTTIENKDSTISWLEDRIDNQMKRLQSRSKEIKELKTELAIRNVPLMKESLKSSARLALRQDDEITALKAELASMERDSDVFMEVVNVVRDWDDSTGRAFPTLYKIVDLLVDYTDVPEGLPETPTDDGDYDEGWYRIEAWLIK